MSKMRWPRYTSHRTGVASAPAPACIACLVVFLFLPMLVSAGGLAAERRQKSKSQKPKKDYSYALLFGTVFDENGRLVRGAGVRVRQKEGKQRWEARSDTQGEFAVHLPAAPAVYVVEVTAPEFKGDSKEVAFSGDERQDIVIRLTRK